MDGIIIIDKPGGITSFQVVRRVKNILKAAKVGHGGTLDPLATGVLPIFLNRATKLSSFLMNGTKKYRATMKLGVETDTQDCEGKITSESDRIPESHEEITRALNSFKGTIEQVPPMFSALKFQGTPLYKLARKGISLDLKARKVHLHEITPIDITPPFVTFEVAVLREPISEPCALMQAKSLDAGLISQSLKDFKVEVFYWMIPSVWTS